jgi:hypothetical protein
MSWSIYLGGPKSAAVKEIEDAIDVLRSAKNSILDYSTDKGDSLNVSLAGYVSWDQDEVVTGSSTTHNISFVKYVPPPLHEESTPPDEHVS